MHLTIYPNIAKCGPLDHSPTVVCVVCVAGSESLTSPTMLLNSDDILFFQYVVHQCFDYILFHIFSIDDKRFLEFCYLENVKCSFYSDLFCCGILSLHYFPLFIAQFSMFAVILCSSKSIFL